MMLRGCCTRLQDVDKLIDVCTRKLHTEPANSRALLLRASSLVKRGELARAVHDYTTALRSAGDHVDTFYQRGCTFEKVSCPPV
jgi:cytochrome c-type biogenesis protein CcmH/NrfG